MLHFYTKAIAYFSKHVILNSIAHTAGGFGLALLLQHYIKGNAFLPPVIGWIFIGISILIHSLALFS